jgi:ecdysteroid 22-hydroxylase
LAANPAAQRQLQQEAKSLLPTPESRVTPEILSRATFTKAVLKEALRLNPVSVGVGRILQQDAVFSGFKVPKGVF